MENLIYSYPWLRPLGIVCICIVVINFILTIFLAGKVYLSDRTLRKNDGTFNSSRYFWDNGNTPKIWGMVYKASLWGFTIASQPVWGKSGEYLLRNAPLNWRKMNLWQQICFWPLEYCHYKIWPCEDADYTCKVHISWLKYLRERNKPLLLPVEYADHVVSRRFRDVEPVAVYISRHTAVSLQKGWQDGYSSLTPKQGYELMKVCDKFDYTLRCLRKPVIWDDCVPLGDGTALFGHGILDMDQNEWLVDGSDIVYLKAKKI